MTKRDGTGRARTLGIAALSLGLVAGCGKSDRPLAADTTSAMAAPQPPAPSGGAAAGGITAALVAQRSRKKGEGRREKEAEPASLFLLPSYS